MADIDILPGFSCLRTIYFAPGLARRGPSREGRRNHPLDSDRGVSAPLAAHPTKRQAAKNFLLQSIAAISGENWVSPRVVYVCRVGRDPSALSRLCRSDL